MEMAHEGEKRRVVCISDTHGLHRGLDLPQGDILIHAGDFTRHGSLQDAEDFNAWLATLDYQHKFLVLGNHEHNTLRQGIEQVVTNGQVLDNRTVHCLGLTITGLRFSWPIPVDPSTAHPRLCSHPFLF